MTKKKTIKTLSALDRNHKKNKSRGLLGLEDNEDFFNTGITIDLTRIVKRNFHSS